MKILLVEDDDVVRRILTIFLLEESHSLRVADNGREAVRMIEKEAPDLVLTDVMMPEMNGLELIEAVSKDHDLPFVMITGFADADIATRALRAGAWYFILKPVNFYELKSIIDRVADRLSIGQELARLRTRSLELLDCADLAIILGDMAENPVIFPGVCTEASGQRDCFESSGGRPGPMLQDSEAEAPDTRSPADERLVKLQRLLAETAKVFFNSTGTSPDSASGETYRLDEIVREAFLLAAPWFGTRRKSPLRSAVRIRVERERLVRAVARLLGILVRGADRALTGLPRISVTQSDSEVRFRLAAARALNRGKSDTSPVVCTLEKVWRGGTDPGLYLAQRALVSLGGRLSARLTNPDEAVFIISLPSAADSDRA